MSMMNESLDRFVSRSRVFLEGVTIKEPKPFEFNYNDFRNLSSFLNDPKSWFQLVADKFNKATFSRKAKVSEYGNGFMLSFGTLGKIYFQFPKGMDAWPSSLILQSKEYLHQPRTVRVKSDYDLIAELEQLAFFPYMYQRIMWYAERLSDTTGMMVTISATDVDHNVLGFSISGRYGQTYFAVGGDMSMSNLDGELDMEWTDGNTTNNYKGTFDQLLDQVPQEFDDIKTLFTDTKKLASMKADFKSVLGSKLTSFTVSEKKFIMYATAVDDVKYGLDDQVWDLSARLSVQAQLSGSIGEEDWDILSMSLQIPQENMHDTGISDPKKYPDYDLQDALRKMNVVMIQSGKEVRHVTDVQEEVGIYDYPILFLDDVTSHQDIANLMKRVLDTVKENI